MTKQELLDSEMWRNTRDDEPVFLLVARDEFAPEVVRQWTKPVRFHGRALKANDAEKIALSMEEWQTFHGSKKPD